MPTPKKVFISFVSNDREYLVKLTQALNNYNVTSLIINLKVATAGNPFVRPNLQQALKGVKHSIIIISKSYFRSDWHTAEFSALMSSEMNEKSNFVIPIIIDDCELPVYVNREDCIDFSKSFDDGVNLLSTKLLGKKKAFVIMKFGDDQLDLVYEGTIKLITEKYDYDVIRINEIQDSELITPRILKEIEESDLIIADLTDNRPNCYYELGFAHGHGKEIILTNRKNSTIHFDLAANRFIVWETEHELREELEKRLKFIKQNL